MHKDAGIADLPKDLERRLRKANAAVGKGKASYEAAVKARAQLILDAEEDYPRSQIAKALGITVGRVQQIVAKAKG